MAKALTTRLYKLTPLRILLAIQVRLSRFNRLRSRGRIVVGPGTYGTPIVHTFAGDSTRLVVGNYCSIASSASFLLGGNHPINRRSTFPIRQRLLGKIGDDGFPSGRGDTIVGHDVWIGHEALILGGSRIGNGAVIGARAVVSGDIPAFAIVAGNPARIIKYRPAKNRPIDSSEPWWLKNEDEIVSMVKILNDEEL